MLVGSTSKVDVSLSHKSTSVLGQVPALARAQFLLLARRMSVPGWVPVVGTSILRAYLGLGSILPTSSFGFFFFPTRRAETTSWLRSGQVESVGIEWAFFFLFLIFIRE